MAHRPIKRRDMIIPTELAMLASQPQENRPDCDDAQRRIELFQDIIQHPANFVAAQDILTARLGDPETAYEIVYQHAVSAQEQ